MITFTTEQAARSIRRPWSRRAYILVAVLGFAALSAAMGLAFLDSNSTVMPEAVNYRGLVRAQYLAGSGVNLAMHWLMYPPTTVAYGAYWTGANNVSLDGSSDVFSVSVMRSDQWSPPRSDPNLFRIISQGVATDPDGAPRAKRSVVAEVIVPPTGKWQIPYAALGSSGLATYTINSGVTINGDLHANGALNSFGWCQGKVTSAGVATWLGSGPPASITSLAPTYTCPSANVAFYSPTYTIQGKTYNAYTSYTKNDMTKSDANALNALDMGASNPGRVIRAPTGTFKIKADVQLSGTLLVNGTLQLDGNSGQLTSLPNFPALVVLGDIEFTSDNNNVVVNGSILCSGVIRDSSSKNCVLTVNGVCMTRTGISRSGSGSTFVLNWNRSLATIWDVQGISPVSPITVLSWKEN